MEGIFDNQNQVRFYSHQLERLADASPSIFSKQQLFEVLLKQNSKIQKFLERQNILSTSLFHQRRQQTTDSEHMDDQIDSYKPAYFPENQSKLEKDINLFLSHHQNRIDYFQKEITKNSEALQKICSRNKQKRLKKTKNQKTRVQSQLQCLDTRQKEEEQLIQWFVERLYNFITSKTGLVSRMIAQFKMDNTEIMEFFEIFRQEVSDREGLLKFWKEQKNEFGKILRIISSLYLKRRYLEDGFRDKGKMGNIHLTFRRQLMQELKKGN